MSINTKSSTPNIKSSYFRIDIATTDIIRDEVKLYRDALFKLDYSSLYYIFEERVLCLIGFSRIMGGLKPLNICFGILTHVVKDLFFRYRSFHNRNLLISDCFKHKNIYIQATYKEMVALECSIRTLAAELFKYQGFIYFIYPYSTSSVSLTLYIFYKVLFRSVAQILTKTLFEKPEMRHSQKK